MLSEERVVFSRDNIDIYLKELAKEYRKLGGRKLPTEIIVIGGASVLINYGFREMTMDIDALIEAASTMKEAIDHVGDKFDLPRGWLNEDFKRTSSYSPKLLQYAEFYKTFYGVLTVRTIAGAHLIAMKLQSGRQYKSDLSDILGILASHTRKNQPITMEMIDAAIKDLYGSWDGVSDEVKEFIRNVMENGEYEGLVEETRKRESETKDALIAFEKNDSGKVNTKSVEDILKELKRNKGEKND